MAHSAWHSSWNLSVLGISVLRQLAVGLLWSGARVGECHGMLQELVNICRFRFLVAIAWLLWPIVHVADEATFPYGFFFCQARHGLSDLRRRML